MSRRLPRILLHWLVVISLVTAGIVAPVQAAHDGLKVAAAVHMAQAMADMPCGDMASAQSHHDAPCDCCSPTSCDLSTCLGTACLPSIPRIVATVPTGRPTIQFRATLASSPLLDTPLRPPIA